MRRWAVLLLVGSLLAGSTTAALAKGPGGGTPTGTIAMSSYSEMYLGGEVGFDTTTSGFIGNQYPMVAVWCYQGGNLVYMELGQPSQEFLLGGGSSIWLQNGGGADCSAVLYMYQWKGGKESGYALDSTSFSAAASG